MTQSAGWWRRRGRGHRRTLGLLLLGSMIFAGFKASGQPQIELPQVVRPQIEFTAPPPGIAYSDANGRWHYEIAGKRVTRSQFRAWVEGQPFAFRGAFCGIFKDYCGEPI